MGPNDININYVLRYIERGAARAVANANRQIRSSTNQVNRDLARQNEEQRKTAASAANLAKEQTNVARSSREVRTEHVKMRTDIDRSNASFRRAAGGVSVFNKAMLAGRNVFRLMRFPAIATAVGYAAQALSALGGGAVALTGALAPLSGALVAYPALLGAVGQAAGVVALSGIKNLTQAMQGNQAALKRLTPQARTFMDHLKQMKPRFDALRATVQKPLFAGIDRGLKSAMNNFGVLRRVLQGTSKVMGQFAANAGRFLGSRGFGRDLQTIGRMNNVTLQRMGNALLGVGKGLTNIMVSARPFINWLTKSVQEFGQWVASATKAGRESGRLTHFFEQTRAVSARLWDIFKNLGIALINIGKAGAPLGRTMLRDLDRLVIKFREWTQSAEGRNSLAQYFRDIKPPLYGIFRLVGDLGGAFLRLGRQPGLASLTKALRPVIPVLEQFFATTTAAFGPHLAQLLIQIINLMKTFAGTSGPLTVLVDTVTLLVKGINGILDTIPGMRSMASTMLGFVAVTKGIKMVGAISGIKAMTGAMLGLTAATNQATIAERIFGATTMGGGIAGGVRGAEGAVVGASARRAADRAAAQGLSGATAGELAMGGAALGRAGGLRALLAQASIARSVGMGGAIPGLAGRFALGGISRLAGPLGLGLSALAFGTGFLGSRVKGFGNRFQSGMSSLTLGLVPAPQSVQDRQRQGFQAAARSVRGMQVNPQSLAKLNADIADSVHKADIYATDWRGQTMGLRDQQVGVTKALVEARNQMRQILDQRSVNRAGQLTRQFQQIFQIRTRRGEDPVKVMQDTTSQMIARMQRLRPAGRLALGNAYLAWAQEMARKNPALRGQVDKVSQQIVARFRKMGQDVAVVNGRMVDFSKTSFQQLFKALNDPLERWREHHRRAFTDAQQVMVKYLRTMGMAKGAAHDWVQSMEDARKPMRQLFLSIGSLVGALRPQIQGLVGAAKGLVNTAKNLPGNITRLIPFIHHGGGNKGATGGLVSLSGIHRQAGGVVPGTGLGDVVPAMLTPGEFVVRAPAVAQHGLAAMRAINAGMPLHLAAGGAVDARRATRDARDLSQGVTRNMQRLQRDVKKNTQAIHDDTDKAFTDMKDKGVKHAKDFKGDFGKQMGRMHDDHKKRVQDMASATSNNFQKMTTTGQNQGQKLSQSVSASMRSTDSAVFTGMQYIGKATNQALQAFGAQPIKLNVSPPGGAGGQRRAAGGPIGGWGQRSQDMIPAMLGLGEVVLTRHHQGPLDFASRATFGVGLRDIVEGINTPHFMARGGVAGGGVPGHPELHAGISRATEAVLRQFPGLVITSTTGGAHAGGSYHYRGEAADISGSSQLMYQASNWIKSSGLFRSLAEGIHNPNLSVKYGKDVPPSYWGGAVWSQHANHIHLAVAGALQGFAAGVQAAQNVKKLNVGGRQGGLRSIAQASVDAMRRGANKKINKLGMQMGGGAEAFGGFPAGGNNWVATMNQIAQQRHWNIRDWRALVMGESGGHPSIRNPSSGAFGLGQFLPMNYGHYGPGSAPGSTAVQQIISMARYILERYGNPSNAYHQWLGRSPHWYARGGVVGGRRRFQGGGAVGALLPGALSTGIQTFPGGVAGRALTQLRIIGRQSPSKAIQQAVSTFDRLIGKLLEDDLTDLQRRIKAIIDRLRHQGGHSKQIGRLRDRLSDIQKQLVDRFPETAVSQLHNQQDQLQQRLRQLLKGDENKKQKAQIAKLRKKLADIQQTIATAATNWLTQLQDQLTAQQHTSTMAQLGLENLQLQQQIQGIDQSPGAAQAVANYINQTIVPGLQAQLATLQQEMAAARAAGQSTADIEEQIGQTQNDILQAQLDALNAVKENTDQMNEQLAQLGGGLGFEYQGQAFTDLINVGVGA